MSSLIGALGSVVGYIGSEVAEEELFHRLLWPQRYFYSYTAAETVRLALLFSMAGPIHGAALAVLDRFRKNGLYLGRQRGDMLGTAIFEHMDGIRYHHRSAHRAEDRNKAKEVRNGFWVNVLRLANSMACIDLADCRSSSAALPSTTVSYLPSMVDAERGLPIAELPEKTEPNKQAHARTENRHVRAYRTFFILNLQALPSYESNEILENAAWISEQYPSLWTFFGALMSELSTLVVAVAAALWHYLAKNGPPRWFIAYLVIPLVLKLLAVLFTVRRTGISHHNEHHQHHQQYWHQENTMIESLSGLPPPLPDDFKEIFEVDCPSIGFVLIRTPPNQAEVALQFFRHYGHPHRQERSERAREICCIALVYAYVLYFPVGLLLLAWLKESTQYLWLCHQLYCILAMHIVRVCGWQDTSRSEAYAASSLIKNKPVVVSGDGQSVVATLRYEHVKSIAEGKAKLADILEKNKILLRQDERETTTEGLTVDIDKL